MSLLDTPLVTSNQQIGWSLTCERDWQISLRNVLNDEGNVAAKIRLFAFLKNCSGVGAVGARALLRALGLSETRTIRSLGPVQKARILTALDMIAGGVRVDRVAETIMSERKNRILEGIRERQHHG